MTAQGRAPVVTHIFVRGDPYIDSDAVFGVKESLIVPFELEEDRGRARESGVRSALWTAKFDFTLASAG